jgi:hypothetical protein
MEELLNTLNFGDVLYITANQVRYFFISRSLDGGVTYSINNSRKTLPLITINAAIEAQNNGNEINRFWYQNFNLLESKTRGCNLQVLKELLQRL